jgi:hypothetical protein
LFATLGAFNRNSHGSILASSIRDRNVAQCKLAWVRGANRLLPSA